MEVNHENLLKTAAPRRSSVPAGMKVGASCRLPAVLDLWPVERLHSYSVLGSPLGLGKFRFTSSLDREPEKVRGKLIWPERTVVKDTLRCKDLLRES